MLRFIPDSLRLDLRSGAVFALLLTSYAYFFNDGGWNANARYCLTLAMVVDQSFQIDNYHEALFLETGDKAFHDGHYYCDKAIGASLVGVPGLWIVMCVETVFSLKLTISQVQYILVVLVLAMPTAYAGALAFQFMRRNGVENVAALATTFGVFLGTMLWPFSTMFFGHVLAAALGWISFCLIHGLRGSEGACPRGLLILLGGLMGMLAITEYPAALIVLVLTAYYFLVIRPHQPMKHPQWIALPVSAGCLPIAFLLYYNAACFGGPFENAYHFVIDEHYSQANTAGLYGVGWPDLGALYYLTLDPARGLFAQSPVLLLCGAGGWYLWRSRNWRLEAALCVVVVVAMLLVHSAYYLWWGGHTFGPRHVIPALPFLCLPLMMTPRRWRGALEVAMVVSIAHMLIVTSTEPLSSPEVFQSDTLRPFGYSPIYQDGWARFYAEDMTANGGDLIGLFGHGSLVPLVLFLGLGYWQLRQRVSPAESRSG